MDSIVRELGLHVRKLRQNTGMSQEELALKACLNAAHLGQIERGLKKPTIETINRIAEALEIPIVNLFDFKEKAIPNITPSSESINKIVAQLTPMTDTEQRYILKMIKVFKRFQNNELNENDD
jgi:transcriptional regulator with XRE-family HTH domain